MPRKKVLEPVPDEPVGEDIIGAVAGDWPVPQPPKTEKEHLLELLEELQDRKINSIGDLVNLIARS